MTTDEYVIAGGLFSTSAILLAVGWTRKDENDKTLLIWMGFGFLMASLVSATTTDSPAIRWQWILAALPTLMLASHGAFLYYVRSKVVPKVTAENRQEMHQIIARDIEDEADEPSYSRLLEIGGRYFSAQALLLRYGVPAVLLLGISITISNALMRAIMHYYYFKSGCQNGVATVASICDILRTLDGKVSTPRVAAAAVPFLSLESVTGAAIGLVGAYAYVLLYLGKRSFRLDITPGAATWCTVTMAVGPVLGGLLGPMFPPKLPIHSSDLANVSMLFLAGFAPRFVVETLEETARRVFSDRMQSALPARTLPLSQVRGITRSTQERLEEEGIDDASQLAMADPYRLLRNTSFDKRQILRWMDAALLMVHLPEGFAALERRGVTGAMNLTWYAKSSNDTALQALATDAHMDVTVLRSVASQLARDRQQKLIRILYLFEDGEEVRGTSKAT